MKIEERNLLAKMGLDLTPLDFQNSNYEFLLDYTREKILSVLNNLETNKNAYQNMNEEEISSIICGQLSAGVLKPGAHALIFCGPRTYHRMASGVEDAGFEIRDQLQWLFGSGFPKSLDISKAIDKEAGAKREIVGRKKASKAHAISNQAHHSTRRNYSRPIHGQWFNRTSS